MADGNFQGVQRSWEWFSIPGYITVDIGTYVDQMTVVMLFVVTFIALLVMIYSTGYMHGDRRYGWFYAIVSFFVASMLALVLADNLLMLYVGLGAGRALLDASDRVLQRPPIGGGGGEEGIHHNARGRCRTVDRDHHPLLADGHVRHPGQSCTWPRTARSSASG